MEQENMEPNLYDLEHFREDLAFTILEIEKRLENQTGKVAKAKALDPVLRRLSKEVIRYLNAGDTEMAEKKYQELLGVAAEMFAIRGLARQSFYRFRALKETIEALGYRQIRQYIYEGGAEPSLSSIRDLDLNITYSRKGIDEKRSKKIFSEEELDASFIEAMAEVVGEISKGLNFEMAMVDWHLSSEMQEKYLVVGRRALNVARHIISECDYLGSKYSELFDKYFRFMLVRMGDTLGHIEVRINTLQSVIAARQK